MALTKARLLKHDFPVHGRQPIEVGKQPVEEGKRPIKASGVNWSSDSETGLARFT